MKLIAEKDEAMNLKFTPEAFKLEFKIANTASSSRTFPSSLAKWIGANLSILGLLFIAALFVPIPRFYPDLGLGDLFYRIVAFLICFLILPVGVVGVQALIAQKLGYHIQALRAGIFSIYYRGGKYRFRLLSIDSNRPNGSVFYLPRHKNIKKWQELLVMLVPVLLSAILFCSLLVLGSNLSGDNLGFWQAAYYYSALLLAYGMLLGWLYPLQTLGQYPNILTFFRLLRSDKAIFARYIGLRHVLVNDYLRLSETDTAQTNISELLAPADDTELEFRAHKIALCQALREKDREMVIHHLDRMMEIALRAGPPHQDIVAIHAAASEMIVGDGKESALAWLKIRAGFSWVQESRTLSGLVNQIEQVRSNKGLPSIFRFANHPPIAGVDVAPEFQVLEVLREYLYSLEPVQEVTLVERLRHLVSTVSRFLFVQYIHVNAMGATVALFALILYSGQCTLDTQTSTTEETEVTRSANLALMAQEFDKALPFLQRLVKEDNFPYEGPRQAIYTKTGLAYAEVAFNEYDKGQFDVAFEHINQAIEYNPYDLRSYLLRGSLLASKEEWGKAILDYNHGLEFNPPNAVAVSFYWFRTSALRRSGQWEEAIRDATLVLETYDKVNQESYIERGISYCMLGQFDNANADFAHIDLVNLQNSPEYKADLDKCFSQMGKKAA